MNSQKERFMDWIELHERAWGDEQYPDRPGLKEMLDAPCVTFWRPLKPNKDLRYTCKLFQRQAELEHYLTRLLYRPPDEVGEKIARVFIGQKLYAIKSVRVQLQEVRDPLAQRLEKP